MEGLFFAIGFLLGGVVVYQNLIAGCVLLQSLHCQKNRLGTGEPSGIYFDGFHPDMTPFAIITDKRGCYAFLGMLHRAMMTITASAATQAIPPAGVAPAVEEARPKL